MEKKFLAYVSVDSDMFYGSFLPINNWLLWVYSSCDDKCKLIDCTATAADFCVFVLYFCFFAAYCAKKIEMLKSILLIFVLVQILNGNELARGKNSVNTY